MIRSTLDHITQEAPGILTLWLQPEKFVRFTPGDFVEIYMPNVDMDARGNHREFSIVSGPNEKLIGLTIKFVEDGSTFKKALLAVPLGGAIQFTDPMGAFVLPKDPTIPAVLIAGGVGVAPYRSMVLSLQPEHERNVTLIYAARSSEELIFADVFRNAPIDFVPIVTQPDPAWHGETGRLSGQRILDFVNPAQHKNALFYLSGPEAMFTELREQLLAAGISSAHIVLDYYPGYTEL